MRKIKDGSELEPVRRALKELETLALKKRGSVEAITDADCSFHNAVTAMPIFKMGQVYIMFPIAGILSAISVIIGLIIYLQDYKGGLNK